MLLEDIINPSLWNEFLKYKLSKDFISDKEKEELNKYITSQRYLDIASKISSNSYTFSIPTKHLISKGHSGKKRIVYTFTNDEMIILKFISFLLYEYDYLFSPNLYSFRKSSGVKNAIYKISKLKNIKNMYGYKVDISNYFNSINTEILLKNLEKDLKDKELYSLIKSMLSNKQVIYNNEVINEEKGVIAGAPTSSFLANYYIKEIDEYFWKQNVVYYRYADDIIIFCNSEDELVKNVEELKRFISKYKLSINKEKEHYYKPGEKWEFLGFSFKDKTIDISSNSTRKIKAKIRRTARGLRRWMIRNNKDYKLAVKAMNRKYNRKFFGKLDNTELSWKYWFFPVINTTSSLKIIDNYMQQEQRYIATGKHNKMNFKKVPYLVLKECGYRALVNEYYDSRKGD